MSKNWVVVASAEHVRLGRSKGFMQVCHGKSAPLRRIHPGDGVVYYSPTIIFRGKDKLQSFTAIGIVKDGGPYQADMGRGFCPYRRDVAWQMSEETPIKPLLPHLEFTRANNNWVYQLRFGLFEITAHDMALIGSAMQVSCAARNSVWTACRNFHRRRHENAVIPCAVQHGALAE